jgi:hypothetical protein
LASSVDGIVIVGLQGRAENEIYRYEGVNDDPNGADPSLDSF